MWSSHISIYSHNIIDTLNYADTYPHPQHVHVSLLSCPVDGRPAIFVGDVQLTASNDESPHSLSSAPHGRQEEGGCSIIVRHLLVTFPAQKLVTSVVAPRIQTAYIRIYTCTTAYKLRTYVYTRCTTYSKPRNSPEESSRSIMLRM